LFEPAILGIPMGSNDQREDYVRVRLERDDIHGTLVAFPFPSQDSSMLLTLARANGLVRRRPFAPPADKGTRIDVIRLDGIADSY
jgi:molybdopterin molybdotransferase